MSSTRQIQEARKTPRASEVWISPFAVERFVARVRPGLTTSEARRQLNELRCQGQIYPAAEMPKWAQFGSEGWVMVLADLVFPLAWAGNEWAAITCFEAKTLEGERA